METISSIGTTRDRTGFETVERLADVYGRNAALIASIPQDFVWGNNSLVFDWNNYKHQIDTTEYVRLHPQNEPLVVHYATKGMKNYSNSYRLLDHIRVSIGEMPTWDEYKATVNKFLGDVHRSHFVDNVYSNHNGLQAMTAASVIETNNPEELSINYVANQFRGHKQKGKGKGKKEGNSDKSNQTMKPNPTSYDNQKKKGKKSCAWCGENSHQTDKCETFGHGKWDNKQCNRCKGYGHPQEMCVTPIKKNRQDTGKK